MAVSSAGNFVVSERACNCTSNLKIASQIVEMTFTLASRGKSNRAKMAGKEKIVPGVLLPT
jgi:hypothetical protein